MDALELLRAQHEEMQQRFDRVRRAPSSAACRRELDLLGDVTELHLVIVERHLDPLLYELELEPTAIRSQAAHRLIARTLTELSAINPDDRRFDATLAVLSAEITRHCDEEEMRVLPALAGALSPSLLRALARSMLETIAEIENARWIGGALPQAPA